MNGGSLCRQLIDTLESKVRRGVIAEARIDEAYSRILQLKKQYTITGISSPLASSQGRPRTYELGNYPNPFNPSTILHISLPAADEVTVTIFDLLGREIETLYRGTMSAGVHEIRWNDGSRAGGVYFCRMQTSRTVLTAKLLLVK